jgi:LPS-assembly lipoprotein
MSKRTVLAGLELFPVLMNREKLRRFFAGALPHRQTGPTLAGSALALLLLPALGGCGFTPLYADQGVVRGLEHIQVETPQTRTGYLMREDLQDDFALKPDEKPEYRLVVDLNEMRLARGLRADATADRYETRVRVNYTLTRIATGEVVVKRSSVVSVTTMATAQQYAGIAGQDSAQERAAWEASQFIKTQVLRALSAQ